MATPEVSVNSPSGSDHVNVKRLGRSCVLSDPLERKPRRHDMNLGSRTSVSSCLREKNPFDRITALSVGEVVCA